MVDGTDYPGRNQTSMDGRAMPQVTEVEMSVLAHATEDEDKVERALRNLIPPGVNVRIRHHKVRGYYKDPITRMQAQIRKIKPATTMLERTIETLSSLDQYRLLEEIEDRVDEAGNLYLRLDKQKALRGVRTIQEHDSIRLKFRFRIPHNESPVNAIQTAIESIINGQRASPESEDRQ